MHYKFLKFLFNLRKYFLLMIINKIIILNSEIFSNNYFLIAKFVDRILLEAQGDYTK